MATRILVSRKGSKGSLALARALRLRRIKAESYRNELGVRIVNWGHSNAILNSNALNKPEAVMRASNKIAAFQAFAAANVSCVKWTTDRAVALEWIADGSAVFCRTLIRAAGGRGIVIARTAQELVPCRLYTRYKDKTAEYRVHVFQGKVIDITQKCRRRGTEYVEPNKRMVRSYDNGWVFCRADRTIPDKVKALGIAAVASLGLDFGAVDIGVNKKGEAFVFEVNTAPGLEGSTLGAYTKAIREAA